MRYKYIIVEDEKAAFENLRLSMENKETYQFVGHAKNKQEALLKIMDKKPHFIFLDVELGKDSGFDIIKELKVAYYNLPPIIVTTAHNTYAKQAVNNQICYFLSKPINPIELTKALTILEQKFSENEKNIFIRTKDALELIKLVDILCLEADEGYTKFYLSNGKKITVPKSLKFFETNLNKHFYRVHRKYIINILKVKEVKLTKRTILLQADEVNITVDISKDYIHKLRNQFKF